ncbi:MAG TPA: 4Fe-4S binding protein [bacterium]|nr:4Fe-4S binding protein [bacterium]
MVFGLKQIIGESTGDMMDYYDKLREKLDLFPIGFPDSEDCMKILRVLFSPEEARIASHVPNPPVMLTAGRIARKARAGAGEAERILKGLYERNLIVSVKVLGERRYTLMPAVPGLLEMQFMRNQVIDERRAEAGRLWDESLNGEFGEENYGFPTSGARVIPINRAIDAGQRVYSYEEAEKIIRKSGSVAITDCACRKAAGKCDAPLDVCIMLNTSADYLAARGLARRVTVGEALRAMERAADAGLVPTTTNTKPPVQIICNCCTCCCATLRGVTALGKPAQTVSSNFKCAVVHEEKCVACGVCVEKCPMDALSISEAGPVIDESKCVGCGVCAHHCKTGAISLVRKSNAAPFDNSLALGAKMMLERGKIPRVLKGIAEDLL